MAIYVKNCIEFDVMESISCAVDNLLECIAINVRKSIIVTCIHRQPDSKIKACIDIIESFFNDKTSDIYLCRYFNINLLNYYHHHDTKYFLDSLVMLNQPTTITTATATLIDNIFTNSMSGISR